MPLPFFESVTLFTLYMILITPGYPTVPSSETLSSFWASPTNRHSTPTSAPIQESPSSPMAILFCISPGLNRFLTLKKANKFAFSSLNQNFALSLISKINPRECPLIKFKGRSFFFFIDKIH